MQTRAEKSRKLRAARNSFAAAGNEKKAGWLDA